jgi:hypothetical protein
VGNLSIDKLSSQDFKKFEQKYRDKIKNEFENYKSKKPSTSKVESRQYQEFKKQWMPKNLTLYEKACNFSENLLKIQPDAKEAAQIQESIDICHLNATPAGVKSFSVVAPVFIVLMVSLLTLTPVIFNPDADLSSATFFILFSLVVGVILYVPLGNLPQFLASNWRMKASNQMVLAVFYIVTYMRHTSNLENAINFAAEHLPLPLSLDLKKVIWNVETQRYKNTKESLDAYLETWKKDSIEFVEAMHLIESSLYESSDSRRLNSLEKSLSLILDETYEKMLHYAHNLQGPLTMLNMLGIVLPILGLVILPLVVSFMDQVKWYHLFALYNVALPLGVLYLSRSILRTRPTGYGDTDISENNPELKKHRNILFKIGGTEYQLHPGFIAFLVFMVFFLLGISPILMHILVPQLDIGINDQYGIEFILSPTDCATYTPPETVYKFTLLGYKCDKAKNLVGPFGLGASILSLFIPLAFGIGFGLYFKLRSENVMKIRDESKKLEQEFAGALFQLGNRIGDGLPVEIAFSKVAAIMNGTTSGKFFELVSINITKMGMSVEEAIFDRKRGALVYYPSSLIESSMKVLVESSKKGPLVASQALINVSEYIKQIHRVDERLKDLMADTISSLQSQISFLTPAISGIVIGITSMITGIIGNLSDNMKILTEGLGPEAAGQSGVGFSPDFFGIGIPTFYFQVIVGVYVIQIIYIMTVLVNGIRNGSDSLAERYMLGNNLMNSSVLYFLIALIVMLLFNIIASFVTGNFGSIS